MVDLFLNNVLDAQTNHEQMQGRQISAQLEVGAIQFQFLLKQIFRSKEKVDLNLLHA